MSFLKEIKNSLYNPEYYKELVEKPFSHSIKYYCALTLVVSIIVTIAGSALLVPAFNTIVWGIKEVVLAIYPDELEISVQDGLVATNVKEPFVITVPPQLAAEAGGRANLLVIDTATTTAAGQLDFYDTLALLTRDRLTYDSGMGGTEEVLQPFATSSNFTLDKAGIVSFFDTVEPYYKYLTPFIVLGLFMMVILIMLAVLLYLLFVALLVWLVASLNRWDITYLKAYQLSLHFATLGLVVSFLSLTIFPGSGALILFTATLILLALVTFKTQGSIADTTKAAE